MLTAFLQLLGNNYESLSTLYKVTPRVIYDDFEALNTWDHPRSKERVFEHEI